MGCKLEVLNIFQRLRSEVGAVPDAAFGGPGPPIVE